MGFEGCIEGSSSDSVAEPESAAWLIGLGLRERAVLFLFELVETSRRSLVSQLAMLGSRRDKRPTFGSGVLSRCSSDFFIFGVGSGGASNTGEFASVMILARTRFYVREQAGSEICTTHEVPE